MFGRTLGCRGNEPEKLVAEGDSCTELVKCRVGHSDNDRDILCRRFLEMLRDERSTRGLFYLGISLDDNLLDNQLLALYGDHHPHRSEIGTLELVLGKGSQGPTAQKAQILNGLKESDLSVTKLELKIDLESESEACDVASLLVQQRSSLKELGMHRSALGGPFAAPLADALSQLQLTNLVFKGGYNKDPLVTTQICFAAGRLSLSLEYLGFELDLYGCQTACDRWAVENVQLNVLPSLTSLKTLRIKVNWKSLGFFDKSASQKDHEFVLNRLFKAVKDHQSISAFHVETPFDIRQTVLSAWIGDSTHVHWDIVSSQQIIRIKLPAPSQCKEMTLKVGKLTPFTFRLLNYFEYEVLEACSKVEKLLFGPFISATITDSGELCRIANALTSKCQVIQELSMKRIGPFDSREGLQLRKRILPNLARNLPHLRRFEVPETYESLALDCVFAKRRYQKLLSGELPVALWPAILAKQGGQTKFCKQANCRVFFELLQKNAPMLFVNHGVPTSGDRKSDDLSSMLSVGAS